MYIIVEVIYLISMQKKHAQGMLSSVQSTSAAEIV